MKRIGRLQTDSSVSLVILLFYMYSIAEKGSGAVYKKKAL
jgi:hypothetical protein